MKTTTQEAQNQTLWLSTLGSLYKQCLAQIPEQIRKCWVAVLVYPRPFHRRTSTGGITSSASPVSQLSSLACIQSLQLVNKAVIKRIEGRHGEQSLGTRVVRIKCLHDGIHD